MATISITTRKTASGKRYDVRYRLGGRAYPVVRAGTFKTERDAKARRDLVAGEIAYGRNPADLLVRMEPAGSTFVSFSTWGERLVSSRIDVSENRRKMLRSHLRKIGEAFGDRDPNAISAADVAEWIAEQAKARKPGTVAQYLDVFKVFMDYVGIEPNPARDPKVKLPRKITEEANPPSDEHFLAILDKLLPRWRLFYITIEQGGLRMVAERGSRSLEPVTSTFMDALEATCALEDRVPERKVFQGLNYSAVRQAMSRACRLAKIPNYTPHDLRHRRLTLWHQQGVPARELAERAGHSKPSMSLDVYTHVIPVAEINEERLMGRSGRTEMTMTTDKERAISDALKASVYDIRRLVQRNVPDLRASGYDELADGLEQLLRTAEASAQEFDTGDAEQAEADRE